MKKIRTPNTAEIAVDIYKNTRIGTDVKVPLASMFLDGKVAEMTLDAVPWSY